jgi:transcriptional regulator with XRE-family HTH domain
MNPSLDHYKARAETFAAQCGARVRAGRLNADLTQAQLAAATFAPHPASISHWESGRFMPSVMRQFAIADALVLPMAVLWGHDVNADRALEAILTDRGAPPTEDPGSLAADTNLRLAALATHYLSLECQHDKHGRRCRKTCPECSAPCRCWCHLSQPATLDAPSPEPADRPADEDRQAEPETVMIDVSITAEDRARARAASALDLERWGA